MRAGTMAEILLLVACTLAACMAVQIAAMCGVL